MLYNMLKFLQMLKTYLYIPDQLNEKIKSAAKRRGKSKAEVIRETLEEGLTKEKEKDGGVKALLKLAELGKKYNAKGPRDASVNHDYYLWGLPKRDTKVKP